MSGNSLGLQRSIRITIEFLDLEMDKNPSREVADASNLLERKLKELQDGTD